ncbi:MAG: DUF4097 and DUF4098 domain-containing protein YvlB [Pseudohongiellaceae bacterium]|jgi:DUF4097 and DUF4098 domain-containing protein YvlB
MARYALLLTFVASVLLPACSGLVHQSFNGTSVSERNGELYVDDVLVENHQEIEVAIDGVQFSELKLSVPTGLINVEGIPGEEGHLILDLYTEFEGDGTVSLEGGRLKARSNARGKVLINGIRGTIPAGMSLEIDTGTGQVLVSGLLGSGNVELESGTGPVRFVDCEIDSLDISSGTADIRLQGVHAKLLEVNSGTGDFVAKDCHFVRLRGDSGTGDFSLTKSQVDDAHFESGTGDVRLMDTVITHIRASLGTGDVISDSSTP